MTFSSTRQNLLIDAQGNNDAVKPGGTPVERIITIVNRGTIRTDIDLWINPNDSKSEPLIRWCALRVNLLSNEGSGKRRNTDSELERGLSGLKLPQVAPRESCEVILRIDVPLQAEAGFYSYDILAQASQYSGEPTQRSQQLRVLAPEQDVEIRDEPRCTLEPPTSSDSPYLLKAEATLFVKVLVENGARRVDRFFLACPELDSSWYDPPLYPEDDPSAPGLMARTDGLLLNPGESGEIILLVHPPAYTPSGFYSSTIRLISYNTADLVLLDILYLNIDVDDRLTMNLHPLSQKIPSSQKQFTLNINNLGNIDRNIFVQARDKDEIFTYRLDSDQAGFAPGQSQSLTILPKPQKWWRRSWRGQVQEIGFNIGLVNQLPVEGKVIKTLHLPDDISGKILWQSHPAWILKLLKLLRVLLRVALILLLLTGACGLAYLLLRELVVKPSLEPKILEFSKTKESYQASVGNPIQLDWKINNPDAMTQTVVTYYSSEGKVLLKKKYPLGELEDKNKGNACELGSSVPNSVLRFIRRLYGYSPDIVTLTCLGMAPQPITAEKIPFKAGDFQAKLEVFSKRVDQTPDALSQSISWVSKPFSQANQETKITPQNQPSSDSRQLKGIKLTPAAPPQILYFYSKTPLYRQAGSSSEPSESGSISTPKLPAVPIQLNWIIDSPKSIQALEVSYVNVALDGSIQNKQIRYAVQNGVPIGLENVCRSQNTRLICENVPTPADVSGKYTFTLNVVMAEGEPTARIAKDSEAIEVRPPLPEIQAFSVNGQDVLQTPQLVQTVNPARGPLNMTLTWQVPDLEKMKVELLPAPGTLKSSESSLTYALSPTPGNTTLTLQVTNQAGEMVSRSVTIQTTAFIPPPVSASPTPPNVAVPSSPALPEDLPVFELPPRSN